MKKINEGFSCVGCWKKVVASSKTCRNHCPYCFLSLHVDENIPWDRESSCKSIMYPVDYIVSNQEIKILFVCTKCWKYHWNKVSLDDDLWNLDYYIAYYKSLF